MQPRRDPARTAHPILVGRKSEAPSALRGSLLLRRLPLRRLLQRGVVVQHQHDHHGDEAERRQAQQPAVEAAGLVLDVADQIGADEARQVADRVDDGDAACRAKESDAENERSANGRQNGRHGKEEIRGAET